ncbi:SDR family oxidoreductase [Aeromicrobium phragmitis]|uniref:SDR family oxidoreductase n=1 Tax=Aeromicrobium phragmitis TaxID=2478914 RepID=A0A3L8PMR0_9ACTN|nr:SDR family oxidoreductase [Aeromicrobium phragmitis]RLV55332.1 SDR family oxidoreductase [Aeromicrobium phragmitis]
MDLGLTGRTAVVTGASRGIGLAIAQALHDEGAHVVLTARREEDAAAAATQVGKRALGIGAHVTDEEAARECLERTLDAFGSIDVLVNNAGTNPAFGSLVQQEHSRFAKTLDVNLWGPTLWTQLATQMWMGEHGGSVVHTSSLGAFAVGPNLAVYHASKAALTHLTRHQAQELGPKIRVNAVAPGVVRTRLAEELWKEHEAAVAADTPLGRIGEPEDIGSAVAFLAGATASWITGETLVIDGGQRWGSGR